MSVTLLRYLFVIIIEKYASRRLFLALSCVCRSIREYRTTQMWCRRHTLKKLLFFSRGCCCCCCCDVVIVVAVVIAVVGGAAAVAAVVIADFPIQRIPNKIFASLFDSRIGEYGASVKHDLNNIQFSARIYSKCFR